jgi:hypothetical protein
MGCVFLILFFATSVSRRLSAQTFRVVSSECGEYPSLTSEARMSLAHLAVDNQTDIRVDLLRGDRCAIDPEVLIAGHGHIIFQDRKVGFVRAAVDTVGLNRLLRTRGISFLSFPKEHKDFDRLEADNLNFTDPTSITIPIPTVFAGSLPSDGPYFAQDEAGLTRLWKEYATGDGRGVHIAFLDDGIDLYHPALRSALDLDGNRIPKVRDFLATSEPSTDSAWVGLPDRVQARDKSVAWRNHSWATPYDGTFRIGQFASRLEEVQNYPTIEGVAIVFGVLWDPVRDVAWIDTNGNFDFRDETPLRDYGVNHDVAYFGVMDKRGDNRIPFGIKIDRTRSSIRIYWGGMHGATAGPLSMNTYDGGIATGAAPASQLIDASWPNEVLTSFIAAASSSDVDLINRSGSLQTSDADFDARVVERTLRVYQKPIACACNLVGAVGVMDWQSAEMLRRNRRLAPPWVPAVHGFLESRADGLVNEILAPSTSLIPRSRYAIFEEKRRWAGVVPDGVTPDLPGPDGYMVSANPSPTIPVVAGIIADLISLARRYHLRYSSDRITDVLFTSAELLPGFPASQQGHGRVNAYDAWQQLLAMSRLDDPHNLRLPSFSVFKTTKENKRLRTIFGYYAESKAGSDLQRQLWIGRQGGYAHTTRFRLQLKGDPSFVLRDRALLLDNKHPIPIRFTVKRIPGWHVAFVQLVDAASNVIVHEVPLQTRISEYPSDVAAGVERHDMTIPPRHTLNRFIALRRNVQAISISVSLPYTGRTIVPTSFIASSDKTLYLTPKLVPANQGDARHHIGPIQKFKMWSLPKPTSTIWLGLSNRGQPEYEAATSEPAPDIPIHATVNLEQYNVDLRREDPDRVIVRNRLAPFDGKLEWLEPDAQVERLHDLGVAGISIADVVLPAGTVLWRIRLQGQVKRATLYAAHCDFLNICHIVDSPTGMTGNTLTVGAPQAGRWKLLVYESSRPRQHHIRLLKSVMFQDIEEGAHLDRLLARGDTVEPVPTRLRRKDLWAIVKLTTTEEESGIGFGLSNVSWRSTSNRHR